MSNFDKKRDGGKRTVLRIKRRRTEEPLPFIRLEGLSVSKPQQKIGQESTVDNLSSLLSQTAHIDQDRRKEDPQQPQNVAGAHVDIGTGTSMPLNSAANNETSTSAPLLHKRHRTNTCAVWKRRDGGSDKNRSYLIVDALLEESGTNASKRDDEADADETNRTKKRPKLTVLDTIEGNLDDEDYGKKKNKSAFKVLDPLTRMIDDSLQMVFSGEKKGTEHYDLITTDQTFATSSLKWLVWSHSSGGNLLHSCALWNDVDLASELCKLSSILPKLASALDGDERTPYELAQLSGHGSVCHVLEAFGGDTFNFVYDIYDLDEEPEEFEDEMKLQEPDQKSLVVELKGGVGYWTPDGELILEAPGKSGHYWDDADNADEEGEIDSNCEEYGGNDYPDEDWGVGADDVDEGYDDGEGYDDTTFRDRVVDFAEDDYVVG